MLHSHSDITWHYSRWLGASFKCVTWVIHMCDMTHSYVWHDSFIRVTWRIQVCDTTRSYEWLDSSTCLTWLIHMRDTTHSHVRHDSYICMTQHKVRDETGRTYKFTKETYTFTKETYKIHKTDIGTFQRKTCKFTKRQILFSIRFVTRRATLPHDTAKSRS